MLLWGGNVSAATGFFDLPINSWQQWIPGDTSAHTAPGGSASNLDLPGHAASGKSSGQTNKSLAEPAPLYWTDVTLKLIVKYQQNPLRAARNLTYLHTAMHDAMLATAKNKGGTDSVSFSAHSAAAAVLSHFYPNEPVGRFGAMARLALLGGPAGKSSLADRQLGWRTGEAVAHAAIVRAANDGADLAWNPKDRPPLRPGLWQASPPLNAYRPLEAMAPEWRTWVLHDSNEIQPPPPVLYDSDEYWAEVREVQDVAAQLTNDQKRIADEWNLDKGTFTPAGVWNLKAMAVAREKKLGPLQTARLMAAVNVGMMDAFLACWRSKYTHWTQRPVTAIRAKYDPEFLPYLITPPFPSYVSGHASISGAAAEILASFFPDKAATFRTAAEEAARSRLYGGIHFSSDNAEGLKLGTSVGQKVMARVRGASVP